MLRLKRRGLETDPRSTLHGHEGGNPGYRQGTDLRGTAPVLDPTGVLFGTDIGPGSRHTEVARIAEYYRTLLGQLSEEAQERIGHANAEALFDVN